MRKAAFYDADVRLRKINVRILWKNLDKYRQVVI